MNWFTSVSLIFFCWKVWVYRIFHQTGPLLVRIFYTKFWQIFIPERDPASWNVGVALAAACILVLGHCYFAHCSTSPGNLCISFLWWATLQMFSSFLQQEWQCTTLSHVSRPWRVVIFQLRVGSGIVVNLKVGLSGTLGSGSDKFSVVNWPS